ncbi:MAG TPA: 4-hydroxy-3-methylbut-2-enyl diphosphate reductase [Elusimicrobiales bacterium]|nr:4-hydroxy-3-methylbut-2-enyl diphosphate reductase [Elusimicrobiales bacterium]
MTAPEIRVAKTAGFCPGVKNAIETARRLALSGKKRVFTYGPLIHNRQVIAELEQEGIKSVSDLSLLAKGDIIIIRAHGITPEQETGLHALGLEVADATCPLVKKAQSAISCCAAQGYETVIVGDSGHAEVIGLMGYTQGRGHVISSSDEAAELPRMKKAHIVSQTTQEEAVFKAAAEAVRQHCGESLVSDTICQPTKERQQEVLELASWADVMVVVGDRHSANTARLADICARLCRETLLIEDEAGLAKENFENAGRIAVTAGASTPDQLIEKVVARIRTLVHAS